MRKLFVGRRSRWKREILTLPLPRFFRRGEWGRERLENTQRRAPRSAAGSGRFKLLMSLFSSFGSKRGEGKGGRTAMGEEGKLIELSLGKRTKGTAETARRRDGGRYEPGTASGERRRKRPRGRGKRQESPNRGCRFSGPSKSGTKKPSLMLP